MPATAGWARRFEAVDSSTRQEPSRWRMPVLEGHDLVRLVEELAQGLVDHAPVLGWTRSSRLRPACASGSRPSTRWCEGLS